jgi:integrase/recombinase XerD
MMRLWAACRNKTLTDRQIKRVLAQVTTHRYPERVMVLLSVKAGLRAKEIAMVTWGMVTDAEGNVGDALYLLNGASEGKKGGRTVPLNSALRDARIALKARRNGVEWRPISKASGGRSLSHPMASTSLSVETPLAPKGNQRCHGRRQTFVETRSARAAHELLT